MQKERPTVSLALQFKPFHREAFCRFPEGTLGRAAATPRTNLGVPSHPLSPPRKGDIWSPLRGGERGIRAFSGRAPVNSGCPLFSLCNRLRYVYIHTQTARASALESLSICNIFAIQKEPLLGLLLYGGERGIRTPGSFHFNGFQDRRIRPLCHLSERIHKKAFDIAKSFIILAN